MIIYWTGTISEINVIRQNLDRLNTFEFKRVEDPDALINLSDAGLLLITPSVSNPIKLVQQFVKRDRFLSIIILAEPLRYHQLRKSVHFSLSMGKTASCVVFHNERDYSSVFKNAIARTKQKRSFSKFKPERESKLSQLSEVSPRLENLGNILEHAPVGAILLDKDFMTIGANQASKEMFYQLNDGPILLSALFPYKQFEIIRNHITERNESVLAVTNADGNYFEISAFRFSHGGVEKSILLINDVTERKLKDKRIEQILESLPQISWTTSPEGHINFFSQGWYNFTNLSVSESMGNEWLSAVHPEDRQKLMSRWQQAIEDGISYHQASRFKNASGEYRWHLTRAVPLYSPNRKIVMWVGTSTDIHDHVVLTENLERKVKERTKVLEEKNEELEQFAHISSHDLQEPLRKIQTFAHILKDEVADLSSENVNRYLDKIIKTSTGMSKLIRDLLNFTRIDQREEKQLLNLNEVIHQVTEDLEVLIKQNSATVDVADLPVIMARPLQIKQLFYNIINNSIKFKKPDTPPRISVTSQMLNKQTYVTMKNLLQEVDYHEIIIKDNGIGFDQKYGHQIFTIFQRLHTKSSYEGTGMGLSIGKKVVTNHGGEIFAISSPGEGAEFHIVMPQISAEQPH